MMLRSYQVHPCSWKKIISNIQENAHQLPIEAQRIYNAYTLKQLKDRLCNKLSKLLSEKNIQNTEIRYICVHAKLFFYYLHKCAHRGKKNLVNVMKY